MWKWLSPQLPDMVMEAILLLSSSTGRIYSNILKTIKVKSGVRSKENPRTGCIICPGVRTLADFPHRLENPRVQWLVFMSADKITDAEFTDDTYTETDMGKSLAAKAVWSR